ncbi:hypothetical protein ACIRYZ_14760 [Kitasatospora sp. NPDC101155]|uniref:hypothetical protein n=1 Tax=Kitasatospora sp. NPDC101155 TaxID=3364097 RepID=UPI0037FDC95E
MALLVSTSQIGDLLGGLPQVGRGPTEMPDCCGIRPDGTRSAWSGAGWSVMRVVNSAPMIMMREPSWEI